MTDLPRTIPSNPAEQERLMPEWVKVEVCRLWNEANQSAYPRHYTTKEIVRTRIGGIFAHALTIWQYMPEPVDPDLQMAREVCAEMRPLAANDYLSGNLDTAPTLEACLAMAKRVREAKP